MTETTPPSSESFVVHLAEDGLCPQRSPSGPHRSLLKLGAAPVPHPRVPENPTGPTSLGTWPRAMRRTNRCFGQICETPNDRKNGPQHRETSMIPREKIVMIYCSIRYFSGGGVFWLNDIECNGISTRNGLQKTELHWAWGPPSCRSLPPFLHAWRLGKNSSSEPCWWSPQLGTFHVGKLRILGKPIPGTLW